MGDGRALAGGPLATTGDADAAASPDGGSSPGAEAMAQAAAAAGAAGAGVVMVTFGRMHGVWARWPARAVQYVRGGGLG